MFNSQTYGKLNIELVVDKLLEFYKRTKQYDTPVQIIIGTDSQNHSETKIVTVIAITCEGHGGIYFYEVNYLNRIDNVRQKLFTETGMSIDVADKILSVMENNNRYEELFNAATFTIHVDAGRSDKGKTKELIPAIAGWIRSVGYEYEISCLAEIARALYTTPDYLLGFEEEKDPFEKEALCILQGIKDDTVREMLLKQMKALV